MNNDAEILIEQEAYMIFPDDNEYLQRLETKQPQFMGLNQDNNQKQIQ